MIRIIRRLSKDGFLLVIQVGPISKNFYGLDLERMAPGILQDLSPETLVRKHYSDALEDQKTIAKVIPVTDIK